MLLSAKNAGTRLKRLNCILCLVGFLLMLSISGCAPIQKKVVGFWEKIRGEQTEKQTGTREEAVSRYNYRGLRDELIVEPPVIAPAIVSPGDKIKQELQYTLLAPLEEKRFKVSETVTLSGSGMRIELSKRESEKAQGTHLSILQFEIPQDIKSGDYRLDTRVSTGTHEKTVSGSFRVKR